MSAPREIVESGEVANYLQRNLDIVRLVIAKKLTERGFILETLEEAVSRDCVKKLLWRILPEREGIVKGAFIYVPPNTRTYAPLSMCFVVDKSVQKVHNVLVVGENSKVTVSTTCLSAGEGEEHQGFTEIFLGKGARLDYVTIHGWSKQTSVVAEVGVMAEENAAMNEVYISLKTPRELKSLTKIIGKRGSSVLSSTLYVTSAGNSTLETYVTLEEEASAEVLSRIVAARGALVKQPITVEAWGEGARGHIECRGLQLDPVSVIETIPALRSMHGGTQLTHEAAIGKLSQEELEYLMSKGFTEDEAVTLLVRGFLELGIKSLPEALKPQVAATLDLISKAAKG